MASSTPPPHGIYVPAVLFFTDNEDLDLPAIQTHVLRLAQGGVTGILVQGSNGEAQHLDHHERKRAIAFTRQVLTDHGFPHVLVIAGTGAQSTRETIKLCVDAKDAGASHVLVLTPSTWPPQMSKENILRFFTQVADASPVPVMIYNFPTVTAGIDLDSDTISALATHPNIVGTKLSCGNIGKLHRITQDQPNFAVFAGKSDVLIQGLMSGSAGAIAALPNIVPKLHKQAYDLHQAGKIDEAMEMQAILGRADWAVSKIGGIAGVKAIVAEHFGYGRATVRGPLKTLAYGELARSPYLDTIEQVVALEKAL